MIWDVKLYVGGKVFVESVHAVNRDDALETAKARNPKAKVIGVSNKEVFELVKRQSYEDTVTDDI